MRDRLIDWWRRRGWTPARYVGITYVSSRRDVPELPARRAVMVVGTPDRAKWAVFTCPCGHGHQIAVNLAPTRRPTWRLIDEAHGPSLHPSVDSLTTERRCHFWLRDGRVRWIRDDWPSEEILRPPATGRQEGGTGHGA